MSGGIADKQGNDYEYRYGVKLLCELLNGDLISVREDSEKESEEQLRIDFKTVDKNNRIVLYQCKGTSGSASRWSTVSLKKIYQAAAAEFDSGGSYVFVSPDRPDIFPLLNLASSYETKEVASFYGSLSEANRKLFSALTSVLPSGWQSKERVLCFLKKFNYEQFACDRVSLENAIYRTGLLQPEAAFDYLYSFFTKENLLSHPIDSFELHDYLKKRKFTFSSENPQKVADTIALLTQQSLKAMAVHFVKGKYFERAELQENLISSCELSPSVLLTGNQGCGKTALLYGVCNVLQKKGDMVLLIDMTKVPLVMMPSDFGKNLGFDESPISVFRRFYPGKTCFLVLDQLDSCLLNSVQGGILVGLCEKLLFEIQGLSNIHVLMTCRSLFANEFDRLFSETVKNVSVPELSLEEIETFIGSPLISGSPLASLLSNFLFLSLYLQLKDPKVKSCREVIIKFIEQNELVAQKRGISSDRFEKLLQLVAERIRLTGQLRVPLDYLRETGGFSICEIDAACDSHLLVLEDSQISFTHQSVADFLIADNLAKSIFSKRKGLVNYILEADQESLATYDSIQQLFQLLLQNSDNKMLDRGIKELLDSRSVRPLYKEIAFSALGALLHPSFKECRFALSMLKRKERKQCLASSCTHNKIISEYLFCHGKLTISEKIDVLFSLYDVDPVFVAEQISADETILDKGSRLLNYLDPLYVSDSIFSKIVASIQKNPDFFFTDSFLPLATKKPERCFDIINAAVMGGEPRRSIRKEWFQSFLIVAKRLPEQILLLCSSFCKKNAAIWFSHEVRNYESDAYSLVLLLTTAAYSQLVQSKKISLLFAEKGNSLFQKQLLDSLTKSGSEENPCGTTLILSPSFFTCFDFSSNDGLAFSCAHVLARYMPCLNETEQATVINRIFAVRPSKKNYWNKKSLLKLRSDMPSIREYWLPSSEDEQYLLLKDLPLDYFDEWGKRYVAYLKRKFPSGSRRIIDEKGTDQFFNVVSPIHGKGDSFSEATWGRILVNPKTGSDHDSRWLSTKHVSNENALWTSEIEECASNRPALFFRILQKNENKIKRPFRHAILNGVMEACNKTQEELPVDSDSLFQEISSFFTAQPELENFLMSCLFSESVLWQEKWVQKFIIERAERFDGIADEKPPVISSLESDAINEKRCTAVLILGKMIQAGYLPDYNTRILADSLLSSPKASERLSAIHLFYGQDKTGWKQLEFVDLLEQDPEFLGIPMIAPFLNCWVEKLSKSLTPIFLTAAKLDYKEVISSIAEYAIAYYVYHGSLRDVYQLVIDSPGFYIDALEACVHLMKDSNKEAQKRFRSLFVLLLEKGIKENFLILTENSENTFDSIIESVLWELRDSKNNAENLDVLFALCDVSLKEGHIQRYIASKIPPLLLSISTNNDARDVKQKCFDYLDRFYREGYCSQMIV